MYYQRFASESVSQGHPDKICDQISDAILDAVLTIDPAARVAADCAVKDNHLFILGEVTARELPNFEGIARQVIADIGYTDPAFGFSDQCQITTHLSEQSPEIGQGVDQGGAGDQGMMFGYACRETEELMPLPIRLAHSLMERYDTVRRTAEGAFLRPDAKAEVVVRYDGFGKPSCVDKIVMAASHSPQIQLEELKQLLYINVISPVMETSQFQVDQSHCVINGSGAWHVFGPVADSGLTGRKIIVDTYGGMGRHGGGAFSGKDASKVDRSGAYAARYLAKNIVTEGLAERCEVQVAYAIGQPDPVNFEVETFDSSKATTLEIKQFLANKIDISARGIFDKLKLNQPIFRPTASYGHFGRVEFPWEKTI